MEKWKAYCGILFRGVFSEYQWTRDALIGAGLGVASLLLTVQFHLMPSSDWKQHWPLYLLAVIAPYVLVIGIHITWKVCCSVVTIHADQQEELCAVAAKLREIENAKPNLILKEPGAKHIRSVTFRPNPGVVQFVSIRFVNAQKEDGPTVPTQGITAVVSFWDEAGKHLLEMDGKWESRPIVPPAGKTLQDMLRMEFSIEQKESVDIAFWDMWTGQFIAFNHDSSNHHHLWKPGHELGRGPISAKVRLIGVAVDKTFDLKFGRNKAGTVEILD